MTSNRAIRASDQDRERIAAALGGHYAAGRLTLEEFQERLDRTYAAKTLGELSDLMADLPGTGLSQLRGQPGGNPPLPGLRAPGTVQARDGSVSAFWRLWLAVTIGVSVLWLVSGPAVGPWFFLAAIALAYVMLRHWLKGRQGRISDHHQTRQ
jgi:hypothetical protein